MIMKEQIKEHQTPTNERQITDQEQVGNKKKQTKINQRNANNKEHMVNTLGSTRDRQGATTNNTQQGTQKDRQRTIRGNQ